MKKSSLTTAVLAGLVGVAGFATSASAVELNPDGTGQVLIYPYYTVKSNQQTLISVVNTTDMARAVKVRFLEAYNSQEVLDFNLFLSPYDVWTAAVAEMGAGAGIVTSDTSCTVPAIPSSGAPFLTYSFTDGGPTDEARTREGYAELILMSDVVGATAAAVTHAAGVPADCGVAGLNDPSNGDFVAPEAGGLFGNGLIVDVEHGITYPYEADAIDGFTSINLFSTSGSLEPSLESANTAPGVASAYVFQSGGGVVTATYGSGTGEAVDAVSAVFMASSVMNEWVADAGQGVGTDWVITFPTKTFYIDGVSADAPFSNPFVDGLSCDAINVSLYDREEASPNSTTGPIFSPPPPDQPGNALCHEVNVISFSNSEAPVSILGSDMALNLSVDSTAWPATAGWARVGLAATDTVVGDAVTSMVPSAEGVVFSGLPATGFAAQKYIRAVNADGGIANYSGAWRHRIERNISG